MLFSALLVQAIDVYPLRMFRPKILHLSKTDDQTMLRSPLWQKSFERFDRIVVYPPYQRNYNTADDYRYFAYLASHYKKPITVGYVARADHDLVEKNKRLLEKELISGCLQKDTLYILSNEYCKTIQYKGVSLSNCRRAVISGFHLLVSNMNGFELSDEQ